MSDRALAQVVVEALRGSKKYGAITDAALERIAQWAAARHANPKDATKAAKRKLHQVYGAFFEAVRLPDIDRALDELAESGSPTETKEICGRILQSHASTAERLAMLPDFYGAIFERTGMPSTVIDLACGLNPFALPWMGLPPESRYAALDLDKRLIVRVNRFLPLIGRPPLARDADLLSPLELEPCDVALLLKTGPCLEQQERGALAGLLRRLAAAWVVVSFPVKTLGGREVGMRNYYRGLMPTVDSGRVAESLELDLGDELVYLLRLAS